MPGGGCRFFYSEDELGVTDVRVSVGDTEVWRLCGTARPLPVLRAGHDVHVQFYSRPTSDSVVWDTDFCAPDPNHRNTGFRLLFTFHPVRLSVWVTRFVLKASVLGLLHLF